MLAIMLYLLSLELVRTRLVGGNSPNEGRVEILQHGIWGTVCDHGWNLIDATVVCKSLGFRRAIRITHQPSFGNGTGPINAIQCGMHWQRNQH